MKKQWYIAPVLALMISAAGFPMDGNPIFSPHLTTPLAQAAAHARTVPVLARDDEEVNTPLYWMSHEANGDEVLLTAPQVRLQNAIMRTKTNTLCDLTQEPGYLTYWRLSYMLRTFTKEAFASETVPTLYNGVNPVTQAEFTAALDNRNLDAVTTANFIRYAVVVNNTDVRRLPTASIWSEQPGDVLHDVLQVTALNPATPLAVLLNSKDGNYAFVQGRDAAGWVKNEDLAFTDKGTWYDYVNPSEDVAVVTSRRKIIADQGQYRLFQMGATIPLETYQSRLYLMMPSRDADGNLEVHRIRTGWDETIHHGYLPLTKNNIIRQSFQNLGAPYAAHDAREGVDDAGMAYNVYRTMGLRLPRTSQEQQRVMPLQLSFAGYNEDSREKTLSTLPAGSLLFTPDHTLLYLGENSQGKPMAIHNVVDGQVAVTPVVKHRLVSAGNFYQRREVPTEPAPTERN